MMHLSSKKPRRRVDPWSWIAVVVCSASALAGGPARVQGQAHGDGEVRLALADYRQLLERAEVDPVVPVPAAAPVSLESAELTIELAARSATVDLRLQLVAWSADWLEVALPATDRVMELTLGDGLEGRLDPTAGVLRVRGTGRHEVRIRQAFDVESLDGATRRQRLLEVPLPRAARVRGTLRDVDPSGRGDVLELTAGGAVLSASDGSFEFVGAPAGRLRVRALGESPASEGDDAPLRFSVSTLARLAWAPTSIDVALELTANVLQGRLDELRMDLATGFEVVNVQAGRGVGEVEWRIDGEVAAEGSQLVVRPVSPLRGAAQLKISLRGASPKSGTLSSPVFPVTEALRQRQLITWTVVGDGILENLERQDLIEIGGGESDGLGTPIYEIAGAPGRWRVLWPEKTEVLALRVDELLADLLVGVDGRAVYNARLDVAHRGARVLQVQMPKGFELVRAERDGSRSRPGRLGEDRLALHLDPAQERHRFQIVGVVPLPAVQRAVDSGGLSLPVPSTDAPISRVVMRAQLPDGWRWRLADRDRVSSAGMTSTADLLQEAAGFEQVVAVWSAMSAEPSALRLEVSERREREEWL